SDTECASGRSAKTAHNNGGVAPFDPAALNYRMFRLSAAAVATGREGHRPPRLDRAGQRLRGEREPHKLVQIRRMRVTPPCAASWPAVVSSPAPVDRPVRRCAPQ